MEERQKKLTGLIREQKDRGEESMLSNLGYKPREIVQKENTA